jgi:hypothetical protein
MDYRYFPLVNAAVAVVAIAVTLCGVFMTHLLTRHRSDREYLLKKLEEMQIAGFKLQRDAERQTFGILNGAILSNESLQMESDDGQLMQMLSAVYFPDLLPIVERLVQSRQHVVSLCDRWPSEEGRKASSEEVVRARGEMAQKLEPALIELLAMRRVYESKVVSKALEVRRGTILDWLARMKLLGGVR